ncbi:probable ATP-dependent RNA helicase DDX43 [Musca domestica]|uniref:RNA helicase n=2 Tax=Musca domestica TaxID=7370 RepID=A0A9J7CXL4_MUSDO|nr:probable ATP-dependent RNA helicase DDX43 [Musca domestica]
MSDWEDDCDQRAASTKQRITWRSEKDDDYGRKQSSSSSSSRKFQDTIDMPQSSVGRIIGRGGSNIQKLESDFSVRVELDKNRGTVTVSGNSERDVKDAIREIKNKMSDADGRDRERGRDRDGYSSRKNSDYDSSRRNSDYDSSRRNNDYDSSRRNNDFYSSSSSSRYGGSGGGGGGGSSSSRYQSSSYDNNSYGKDSSTAVKDDTYDSDSGANNGTVIDWDKLNKRAEVERKKRWAKCPPLRKDFYKEHPDVANMNAEDVARIRLKNNNTTVSRVFAKDGNDDIPNPVTKFEHCFGPYPDLMAEIQKQDFKKPSPIQAQAWPILLKGEDLIGIAQTGTGKTLAFLLPAMIHTEYQSIPRSQRGGPNVLVMAPTRELALQIEKEVNKYSFRNMKAVCIYGGGSRRDQIGNVESGAEIIICTPGRLNDLIQANVIDIATITYLVLDEADRMLDMGFEPQIRKILLDIRPDRQTVMTSATWPPGVRRLAESYMSNPIQVCVGSLDLAATHTVKQLIEIVEEDEKFYMVKSFVKKMSYDEKVIIFCGKKVRADDLSSDLTLDGFRCQCIHGSRDQSDREQAIADITSGEVNILIATDIASRGLDIEDITHVINFDFPRNIEEYVHRVGRTGRAGRTGTSISYITRSDWAMAPELIAILEEAGQKVPSELRTMAERFAKAKERRADENRTYNRMRGGRDNYGNRGGGRRDRF